MTADIPNLSSVLSLYKAEEKDVVRISFTEVLNGKPDPSGIVQYMQDLDINIKILIDLLKINEDEDEEELYAHLCQEGIAISHKSDGLWFLFTN
ncbi:MAG: hypothetical protein AB7U85_00500 [Alphaproteobacteria bacterium]